MIINRNSLIVKLLLLLTLFYNKDMKDLLNYKTIKEAVVVEQEINKSKFISYLEPVKTEDEAKAFLKDVKKQHPKATHHCSAYVVGEIERSNDDGEPASSAGLPMLQVLRGNDLQNVIAVVVRYYGGIKLGVGGLIRAYGGGVSFALEHAQILTPKWVYEMDLTFPYEYINAVETHCTEIAEIIDRKYDANVTYTVTLEDPKALDELNDLTRGTVEMNQNSREIQYI